MTADTLTIKIADNVYDLRSLIALYMNSFAAPKPASVAVSARMVLIEEAERYLEDLLSEGNREIADVVINDITEHFGVLHAQNNRVGDSDHHLHDYLHFHGDERLDMALQQMTHEEVAQFSGFNEDEFWEIFLANISNRSERNRSTTEMFTQAALIEDIIAEAGGEEATGRLVLDPSIAGDLVSEQIQELKRYLPLQK
jgi:hypothetical protein